MLTENNGYVKLFRKIIDDEWYQDSNTIRLYMHCLLRANYKDGKWQGIKYEQGEFVTSHKSLANELGLSVQNIRTSLKKLILTDKLTSKATNKYTIIKVVNWLKYYYYENDSNKQTNTQSNKPLTINQQTTNKQLTTDKKDNKEKNDKKEKNNYNICFEKIVSYWNNNSNLSKVITISDTRKKAIKKRIEDFNEETIFEMIDKVSSSDFLQGKTTDWKANFDWCFKSANFIKIMEDNYLNKKQNKIEYNYDDEDVITEIPESEMLKVMTQEQVDKLKGRK